MREFKRKYTAQEQHLNKEMNDIMEVVQALEDSNIFIKGVPKTIEN